MEMTKYERAFLANYICSILGHYGIYIPFDLHKLTDIVKLRRYGDYLLRAHGREQNYSYELRPGEDLG